MRRGRHDAVRARLTEHWKRTHPAAPSETELQALVEAWIDDEALYREGLARGLAENDPQIRERVVSQMAYVLQSRITVPAPTDDELRAWFGEHAERYARPERVDFTQVFVDGDYIGVSPTTASGATSRPCTGRIREACAEAP